MPYECAHCGALSPRDNLPLTWSTSVEDGRTAAWCESCTRDNVRSMEARLDSTWW